MAELPEVKESVKVQPSEASPNFGQSLGAAGALNRTIGSFGANIALEASKDMARENAIEMATEDIQNNRKRNLFPALNEVTGAYNEIYKHQEYAISSNNISKFLNQLTQNTLRIPKPNGNTIAEFEGIAQQGIEDFTKNLTPEVRNAIRLEAQGLYDVNKLKVENLVANKNDKVMVETFNESFDRGLQSIQNLASKGDVDRARGLQGSIHEMLADPILSRFYTQAEINERKDTLDRVTTDALKQREAWEKSKTPKELEEHLKNQVKEPWTEDNLRAMRIGLQTLQQRDAMNAAYEAIAINEANTMRELGTFTPSHLISLKAEVSAEKFSAFEHSYAKQLRKERELEVEFDSIRSNKDNAGFLATKDSSTLYKFLQQETANRVQMAQARGIPMEYNLESLANTAKDYKVNIPKLDEQISATIMGGPPKEAAKAMTAVSRNSDPAGFGYNPFLFAGVDTKAKALSQNYMKRLQAGNKPEEAYIKAKEAITNVTPQEIEGRKAHFKEATKQGQKYDMSTYERAEAQTAKHLEFSAPIPAGLALLFKDEFETNAKFTETLDDALKMTVDTMRRVWGETTINGKKEVMFAPPEMFVFGGEGAAQLMTFQAWEQIKGIADASKALFDKHKEQPFYWQVDNPYTRELSRVYRNGEVQKGEFRIDSDDRTFMPEFGNTPDYYLSFEPSSGSGTAYAIPNPLMGFTPARYIPDTKNLEQLYMPKYPDKSRNEVIDIMRNERLMEESPALEVLKTVMPEFKDLSLEQIRQQVRSQIYDLRDKGLDIEKMLTQVHPEYQGMTPQQAKKAHSEKYLKEHPSEAFPEYRGVKFEDVFGIRSAEAQEYPAQQQEAVPNAQPAASSPVGQPAPNNADKIKSFDIADKIKHINPHVKPEILELFDPESLSKYGVTTDKRFDALLSQISGESDFNPRLENPRPEDKAKYKRRADIGDKYIGRGLIQLTSKYNYEIIGKRLGIDLVNNPELADDIRYVLPIALEFWKWKDGNKFADKEDIAGLTKAINGRGAKPETISKRQSRYNKLKKQSEKKKND